MAKNYVVYKATNTDNNKSYIGCTGDLSKRQASHRYCAKKGSHYKIHEAIREHGFDAFTWTVLATSADKLFLLREVEPDMIRLHNTSFKSGGGYNVCTKAVIGAWGRTVDKKPGRRSLTQEEKDLRRVSSTAAKIRPWIVVWPDGRSELIWNLKAFCKSNDLNPSHMCRVAHGERAAHKGFRVSRVPGESYPVRFRQRSSRA